MAHQVPPHLRDATGKERCGVCVHFSKGKCRLYDNYPVSASETCDSFKARPKKLSRSKSYAA